MSLPSPSPSSSPSPSPFPSPSPTPTYPPTDWEERFLSYLVIPVCVLFLLAILGLGHPRTSQIGNILGVIGMALGIAITIADEYVTNYWLWAVALFPTGFLGAYMALTVDMTSMPQMVGLLNALGGGAAAIASLGAELVGIVHGDRWELHWQRFSIWFGIVIGAATFSGSLLACLKLQSVSLFGRPLSRPMLLPFHHVIIFVLFLVAIVLGILYELSNDPPTSIDAEGYPFLLAALGLSLILGVLLVSAIGGADMPVVISVLNSCSGWSTCAAGFTIINTNAYLILIVAGALVGASGSILSYVMCKAMNRPFFKVILGGFGDTGSKKRKGDDEDLKAQETNVKETVHFLLDAHSIVIVPGYGMAVAQAQYAVAGLVSVLEGMHKKVTFGIHPVAGRLPGHMNVLLAEAHVSYDIVLEMDEINPHLPNTDVVIVIGANDTVNPSAVEDPDSPIAGMPVLEVWRAHKVVVLKRSLGAGYSGAENPLFFKNNNWMLFGDAKKNCDSILAELHQHADRHEKTNKGKVDHRIEMDLKEPEEDQVVVVLPDVRRVIGVPKEIFPGENRVALVPEACSKLRQRGYGCIIESGAGLAADYTDDEYLDAGCEVVDSVMEVYEQADIIFKVRCPGPIGGGGDGDQSSSSGGGPHEVEFLNPKHVYVSYINPAGNEELIARMAEKGCTALSMDCVPRTSKAQKLDSLSSMANLGGYRAVMEAANVYGSTFMGQITSAGKLEAAKVLVIGAGVSGLAAIGAAKSLGAIVRAFDTRLVTKEQVESMGAEFLVLDFEEGGEGAGGYAKVMSEEFLAAEMALFHEQAKEVDIIITTASIPNRRAPILIKEYMIKDMKPGSVLVDLAAHGGGNVEGTVAGTLVTTPNLVRIIGYTDLPSRMAHVSSRLYAANLVALLGEMDEEKGAENFKVDDTNSIIDPMIVCRGQDVVWAPPQAPPPSASSSPDPFEGDDDKPVRRNDGIIERLIAGWDSLPAPLRFLIIILLILIVTVGLGALAPITYHTALLVFCLAFVLGYLLIWNVTPALHTPLMSVTNAISGVVLLSGLVIIGDTIDSAGSALGFIAVVVASVNVFGGFVATQRMLAMFKRR